VKRADPSDEEKEAMSEELIAYLKSHVKIEQMSEDEKENVDPDPAEKRSQQASPKRSRQTHGPEVHEGSEGLPDLGIMLSDDEDMQEATGDGGKKPASIVDLAHSSDEESDGESRPSKPGPVKKLVAHKAPAVSGNMNITPAVGGSRPQAVPNRAVAAADLAKKTFLASDMGNSSFNVSSFVQRLENLGEEGPRHQRRRQRALPAKRKTWTVEDTNAIDKVLDEMTVKDRNVLLDMFPGKSWDAIDAAMRRHDVIEKWQRLPMPASGAVTPGGGAAVGRLC